MAARETENNAYAKFWGDKQRYGMLWYFLEWSIEKARTRKEGRKLGPSIFVDTLLQIGADRGLNYS